MRSPSDGQNLSFWTCALDRGRNPGPAVPRKAPDPVDEGHVHLFTTSVWEIGPVPELTHEPPFQDAPQTEQPRHVEEDDSVASLHTNRERSTIVSIHNPSVAVTKYANAFVPFVGRSRDPARFPVVAVQMNQWKTRSFREFTNVDLPGSGLVCIKRKRGPSFIHLWERRFRRGRAVLSEISFRTNRTK